MGILRLAAALAAAPSCTPARPEAPPPAAMTAAPAALAKEVSFAIVEDYEKGHDLRDVERDFELMKELDVRTWRGRFGWDELEPQRDRYDFDWLERFAELAARHEIELRPYIAGTPAWAAAEDDEWTDFVHRLASAMRRHANVRSWEIYREENARPGWSETPRQYADVLARAARAVREADPGAKVLMGGLAGPDAEWVKIACDATRVDIVAFPAYPETRTPDSVDVERFLGVGYRDRFLPAVRAHCGDRPVWINEAGFPTLGEQSERDQADWWARAFATFLADPLVRHLGIRELRDSPLGLTRRDRTAKLAFHTVDLLTDLLDVGRLTVADAELDIRVTAGRAAALYHHLFVRPDGRQVLLVWDKRGSPALDITLARRGARVTEYTLDGRPVPFPQFDGRTLRRVRLAPGHVRIFDIAPCCAGSHARRQRRQR